MDIPFGQTHLTQHYRPGGRERGWESAMGQRTAEQRFQCRPGGCTPQAEELGTLGTHFLRLAQG